MPPCSQLSMIPANTNSSGKCENFEVSDVTFPKVLTFYSTCLGIYQSGNREGIDYKEKFPFHISSLTLMQDKGHAKSEDVKVTLVTVIVWLIIFMFIFLHTKY